MKVLVVVDMQRDFIDGALGTDEAVAIVDGVKRKIAEYERAKDMVIFTRDTHESDYLETQEGRKLPVPKMRKLISVLSCAPGFSAVFPLAAPPGRAAGTRSS